MGLVPCVSDNSICSSDLEETTEGANDSLVQSIIVTMVMTSREHNILSKQEPLILQQAKHVLPGHVGVSRDLCHILDLKELSVVRLQSVSYGSAVIRGIVLHPHEDVRQKVDSSKVFHSGVPMYNLKVLVMRLTKVIF